MRRCEVFTEGREWREIAYAERQPGMVIRIFEADGTPYATEVEETGERVTRWRVMPDMTSEPIPESGVERAIREQGFHWPGGANPADAGWVPRRLR